MPARKNRPTKAGFVPTATQAAVAAVRPTDLAKRPAAPLTVSTRRVAYTSQSR